MREDKTIKVSVVMPFFNSENTLEESILSLSKSTFNDMEIILVNDGSTDKSSKIANNFVKFKKVHLKQNRGAGSARNAGANIASGEILVFIDSDTVVYSDTVQKMIDRFKDQQVVAFQAISDEHSYNKGLGAELLALKWNYGFHNAGKTSALLNSYCFAIRKDIFFEIGGFTERFKGAGGEEFDFGHKLNKKYVINIDKNIKVKQFYKSVFNRAKVLFVRTRKWSEFFCTRLKPESHGGARLSEMLISFLSCLVLGVIFFAFLLFLAYLIANLKFYNYVCKIKGILFTLLSVFPNFLWSISAGFGFCVGILDIIVRKLRFEQP